MDQKGERVDAVPVDPQVEGEAPGRSAEEVGVDVQPTAWQMLVAWRRKQALEDYKGADQVRTAIKLILKNAITRTPNPKDPTKFDYTTNLKPHEVRQITQALESIQRIQRLSLGLSTENLGIDQPVPQGQTHVEKNVTPTEDPIPTFVVEMSVGGKFLRPRPRRVK